MQGFCVDMLVFIWKKAYDRCGLVKDYALFSLFLILMTKKFIMIVNFFVSSAPFWYLVLFTCAHCTVTDIIHGQNLTCRRLYTIILQIKHASGFTALRDPNTVFRH